MMTVPCIDCITLGMCKARLDGGTMMDLMCLSDQCSLLQSYIYPKARDGVLASVELVGHIEEVLCTNIIYNGEPF